MSLSHSVTLFNNAHESQRLLNDVLSGKDEVSPSNDSNFNENSKRRMEELRALAIPTTLEALVLLSGTAIATNYLDSETNWMKPFVFTSACLFANMISRMNNIKDAKDDSENNDVKRKYFNYAGGFVRATIHSLGLTYPRILIHEAGHAIASSLLFENANPKIEINGKDVFPTGGSTRYQANTLTSLGQKLGKNNSNTVVTASGFSSSMLSSYLCLIAAQIIPDNYPEAKNCLRATAILSMLTEISYALLSDCTPGNDFCNLDKKGYSPLVLSGLMVGSMLFLQLLMSGMTYGIKQCCDKKSTIEIEDVENNNNSNHKEDIESGSRFFTK